MRNRDTSRRVSRLSARPLGLIVVLAALLFGGGFAAGQGARAVLSAERHALERQAAPLPGGVGLVQPAQVLATDPALLQLVDVRTGEAFDLSHATDALSMPESEMVHLAPTLPTDRTLVLYCTCPDEKTSLRAARTLVEIFKVTNVVVLKGGLADYELAGGAVTTTAAEPALARQGCGCSSNAEAFKLWAVSKAETQLGSRAEAAVSGP